MKTYFISGHLDVNTDEFLTHYVPAIRAAAEDPTACFVVADAAGADAHAQAFLAAHGLSERTTLYHMLNAPRHCLGDFARRGGYANDASRDVAMTLASTDDIAWVRPGRGDSGTAKNLLRRRLSELGVPTEYTAKAAKPAKEPRGPHNKPTPA